jgi:hypothetical protein
VCVWAGKEKISTNLAHCLRYHAHWQLTREEFSAADILNYGQFDKVDWEMVHRTLSAVPRMYQFFSCKQVFNIKGTNRWLAKFNKTKGNDLKVPKLFTSHGDSRARTELLSCRESGDTGSNNQISRQMDEEDRHRHGDQRVYMIYTIYAQQ